MQSGGAYHDQPYFLQILYAKLMCVHIPPHIMVTTGKYRPLLYTPCELDHFEAASISTKHFYGSSEDPEDATTSFALDASHLEYVLRHKITLPRHVTCVGLEVMMKREGGDRT